MPSTNPDRMEFKFHAQPSASFCWGLVTPLTVLSGRITERSTWTAAHWFRTRRAAKEFAQMWIITAYAIARWEPSRLRVPASVPSMPSIDEYARSVEPDGSYSVFTHNRYEGTYYIHHFDSNKRLTMWSDYKHHPDAQAAWDDFLRNQED